MARQVRLSATSRMNKSTMYQDTDTYGNALNRYYWGTWSAYDFSDTTGDRYHRLTSSDIGRWDNLSYKYYGTVDFAWVLLWVNKITNPMDNELISKKIRIPSKENILKVLARS